MHNRFRSSFVALHGFSLVELMAVIAIAAILLTIGVPSFSVLLEKQRMTTTVNELFAALNLARSEAIQRGTRVDLVPVDGNNWSNGWLVLIDDNGNQKADAGEKIIFTHGAVAAGISITSNFVDDAVKYVAYNGTGRTRTNGDSQVTQVGHFLLQSANLNRRIVLNFLGRARTCVAATATATC
jgi:type IV fimbrial biogenesis protein FimT